MPLREKTEISRLKRLRVVSAMLVIIMLLLPFVLQQTFFPFFRFGMFAEPVTREIQREHFLLAGSSSGNQLYTDLSSFTGIKKSNMDYLLRNYYYRREVEYLLKETALLLPDDVPFDSLKLIRIVGADSTTVARYGL